MVPSPPVLTARIVAGRVPPGNQFWRLNVGGRTDCRRPRRPLKHFATRKSRKSRRNKNKCITIFIFFFRAVYNKIILLSFVLMVLLRT